MKTFYFLGTCSTCKRILAELGLPATFMLRDIKKTPLSEAEIDHLQSQVGSFEALTNKRATLYRQRGLGDQKLTEEDYKNLLLEHYTFLKRPVLQNDEQIFIGNDKKTVAAAKASKLRSKT